MPKMLFIALALAGGAFASTVIPTTAHATPRAAGDLWGKAHTSSLVAEQDQGHRALSACIGGCSDGVCSNWVCPAGEYNYDGDRSGNYCYCGTCGTGQYNDAEIKGPQFSTKSCKTCPAGKYSGLGAGGCTTCPQGQISAGLGAGGCTTCPQGQISASGAESCEPTIAPTCTPKVTGTWKWYKDVSIPPTEKSIVMYGRTSETGMTTTQASSTTKTLSAGFSFLGASVSASVSSTHSSAVATEYQTTLTTTKTTSESYTLPVGVIWRWEMDFTWANCATATYLGPVTDAAITANMGITPCCLPGWFENQADGGGPCVPGSPTVCTPQPASTTSLITKPGHQEQADKGSSVSAGAIAGGASALAAVVAVGAAIRMRRHRALQASAPIDTGMHQNPGAEAVDGSAVPALTDPANAI